jgi:RNA polymerase sigma-70 factor, ECF subfamily
MCQPAGDTDRLAVEQTRAGSPDALAELYRKHAAALYRLAYRLTGARQDAEDVVHDVFVGLPEALHRYEEHGNFVAWLKRVTVRVALMRLRGRQRRREVALDATRPEQAPPAPTDRIALDAALNALPDPLRVVLILKEIEGYSHAEIGGLLGISVVASRVRLNRALKRLRRALEDGR